MTAEVALVLEDGEHRYYVEAITEEGEMIGCHILCHEGMPIPRPGDKLEFSGPKEGGS